jgi:alkylation response protein AidB-like acyl-CoA dehydrogenase
MPTGTGSIGQLEYLDRVAAIADTVRADSEQAEIDRCLGDKTVDALRETGLLRMLLPPRYGGGGLHLGDTFAIVEALSRINGSAGWNLQIGATTASLANDLADERARDEVLGDERTIVAGTINFVNIKAQRAEGGFVFDGPATFLSGSAHADWLVIGGWLHDGGKPQITAGRMPHLVRGLIPIDAVVLRDTWHVSGMRATASNDATLDAMFVPDRFLCTSAGTGLPAGDPAASLPLFSRFGGGLSWVGIGIARGALDALKDIARSKVAIGSGPLAERPDVQVDTARAHGLIEAGAAFLRGAWDAAEAKLAAGHRLDNEDQAMLRLSYVTGAEYAAHATDIIVRAAGSSGLYERDGIERCWRDANAVTKHVTVSPRFYDRVGRILLGLEPAPGPI